MHAIFQIRVRKLTGKPAFLTIADCESEARRIQLHYEDVLPVPEAESNVFRIHSDLRIPDRLTAVWTIADSSGENRAPIKTPLNSLFLTFGRPIIFFIFVKHLCWRNTSLCLTFSQYKKRYGKPPSNRKESRSDFHALRGF